VVNVFFVVDRVLSDSYSAYLYCCQWLGTSQLFARPTTLCLVAGNLQFGYSISDTLVSGRELRNLILDQRHFN